jgi:hypothetical protein
MDLRDDRQRNRLGSAAAERQSHGGVKPRADLVGVGFEIREQSFAPRGGAQQPDIRDLGRGQGP